MKFLFDAFNDRMLPEAQPLIRDARRLMLQGTGHILLPGPPRERTAAVLGALDRLGQERLPRPAVLWITRTAAMAEGIAKAHAAALDEAGWRLAPWEEATHSRVVGWLTPKGLREALEKLSPSPGFTGVELVILDEAHAWAHTEAGASLQCLLERLERKHDIHPRRVGLCSVSDPGTIAWVCGGTGRTALVPDVAPIVQRTRLSVEWANAQDEQALLRRIDSARAIVDGGAALRSDGDADLTMPDPPPDTGLVQIGAPVSCRELAVRLDRLAVMGMPRLSFVSEDEIGTTPPEKLPWQLLQTVAVLQLMLEGRHLESLWANRFPMRLLLEQTQDALSSPRTPAQLAREVLPLTPLRMVTPDVYRQVLEHLYKNGVLKESDGALCRDSGFAPGPELGGPTPEVVERMRLLLLQRDEYAYLQPAALHALQSARELAAQFGLHGAAALEWRADVLFVPWLHETGLALLQRMLERGWAPELGMKRVERTAYGLKLRMSADASELLARLRELKREPVRAERYVEAGDELPELAGLLPEPLAQRAYEAARFDARGLHLWATRMFV